VRGRVTFEKPLPSPHTCGELAQVALPRSGCELKRYGSPGANGGCLPAGTPWRAIARIMATVT